MMSLNAVWALMAFTVRRVFVGRRFAACGLILALPPAIALLLAILLDERSGAPFYEGVIFFLTLKLSLFLLALVYGVSLTSAEIEDGTAGYLFLGACPRWMVALAHALVTPFVLGLLMLASIALTYFVAGFSPAGVGSHGPGTILANGLIAAVGLTCCLSFFVFCGYAFRHNVAVSVAALMVWEFLVAALPMKFAAYTVTINLRVLWLHLVLRGERGGWFRSVAGYDLPTYGEASMFLSVTTALFLTLAMVAAMNRSLAGREAA